MYANLQRIPTVCRWLLASNVLLLLFLLYLGLHLLTDITAGSLLGASMACCAMALLMRTGRKSRFV
jgi:membrane-associated phospholipid phosphatase